jgi:hypothetical protein
MYNINIEGTGMLQQALSFPALPPHTHKQNKQTNPMV